MTEMLEQLLEHVDDERPVGSVAAGEEGAELVIDSRRPGLELVDEDVAATKRLGHAGA